MNLSDASDEHIQLIATLIVSPTEAFNSDTSSVSPYMAASSARNNANNANSSFNSRGGFNFEMPTPGSSTFTFPTNNDRMTTKATFPLPALNFAPPTLPYTTGTSFGRASIGSGMGNVNPMNTSAADYLDLDNDTDNTAIDNANININANANTQRRRRPNPNIQNNGNGNGTGNGTANMPNPFLRPARSARAASKAASEGISSWLQFEKDEGKASGEKSSEEESQASEFQEGSDDEYV
ncbi:hypothetical protein BDV95DRAFT_587640 [Massariosphaeria phaeospora]|uniref:Uncharacterized protein n=1 Tax=Massariosphaeria phaeospora TaxID=100035 RepID=A0A7C8I4Q5_9PLEO|nr:hypothetical protein BDV95DRAFT_587640 [Massariosphaeria phaeospora]